MASSIAGYCGSCGAPYFVPTFWMEATPAPVTPTCGCWNTVETTTSTDSQIHADEALEETQE